MLSLSDPIKLLQTHYIPWNSINAKLMIHLLHPFAPMLHMVCEKPYHTELQAAPAQVIYGHDMIINATYIADWKAIAAHCAGSSCNNNERENSNQLTFNYQVGHHAYICVSNLA
jgi:hypothetical protein